MFCGDFFHVLFIQFFLLVSYVQHKKHFFAEKTCKQITANIPKSRLIKPRRNHCDLACKSNTSSSKFNADVNAGYSDECCFRIEIKSHKNITKKKKQI